MNDLISPMGREWLGHLPSFYESNKEFRLLAGAEGEELDRLVSGIDAGFNQRFVDTATWGLARWERELGIKPPAGQPYDQRRAVIRSKMRGTGTVTARLIKSVAEAYSNGEVDVLEQHGLYSISIKFVSSFGIPPNMTNLIDAVRNILPAHLSVEYLLSFTTFGVLESYSLAFDDFAVSDLTFGDIAIWGGA